MAGMIPFCAYSGPWRIPNPTNIQGYNLAQPYDLRELIDFANLTSCSKPDVEASRPDLDAGEHFRLPIVLTQGFALDDGV
jgi:hypothetical protein